MRLLNLDLNFYLLVSNNIQNQIYQLLLKKTDKGFKTPIHGLKLRKQNHIENIFLLGIKDVINQVFKITGEKAWL